MFLIAEPLILVFGLAIALVRQARSPWLVPLRGIAVVYTDVVRGIPTLLLVFLFAFGIPGLKLRGLTNSIFFWATVALVVSYSAYVAEVFRSGIESVHPSQVTSAEALALSRGQTMRHVVVPQAFAARRTPAAQRLRLAAEGHRSGRVGVALRRPLHRARLRGLQLQLHAVHRGRALLRRDDGAARAAV